MNIAKRRKRLSRWIYVVAPLLALSISGTAAAAEPKVPETIYQWVQSSERMNYFFNKEEMRYAKDEEGQISSDTLLVPVIKTYDDIQIDDILTKRRWRMESTDELSDLAGEGNFLTFYLDRGVVVVNTVDLLDSKLSALEHSEPEREVVIEDLTEQSREGIFYRAILDYEQEHREEIMTRTEKADSAKQE
ncbi:MAG: hypothetical protein IKZ66_06130 [Schwartzia sp.]|nr:hypothetical protein [Schwartzia sp. (in: firmicutes)]